MADSLFDPSKHQALTASEAVLVKQVFEFTREFFQNPKFDASHDFNHVMRVVSNAVRILEQEQKAFTDTSPQPKLSTFTVILGALLHDVDDKKYVDESADGVPLAKQELLRLGMDEKEAQKIQKLVEGVSYSTESKDPERTKALIQDIPELAIVQDADRLDAIGAIGIARCFTYGGAKSTRTLELSVQHFVEKLLKLESMMKTQTGRDLAAERSKRLRDYLEWWDNETSLYSH